MFITKLVWANGAFRGTWGFGKVDMEIRPSQGKTPYCFFIEGKEVCGLYQNENKNLSGSVGYIRIVCTSKEKGVLNVCFFDKEEKATQPPANVMVGASAPTETPPF